MYVLIFTLILSILPVLELRAGIPYAILNGLNPLTSFFVCVLANILVIPFMFFFLDYANSYFLKIKLWNKFFHFYLEKKITKFSKKSSIMSFFLLFLFVVLPFPGTGAYTGCLLAWIFELDRKKSFATIGLGLIIAGILVTIATILGVSMWSLLLGHT